MKKGTGRGRGRSTTPKRGRPTGSQNKAPPGTARVTIKQRHNEQGVPLEELHNQYRVSRKSNLPTNFQGEVASDQGETVAKTMTPNFSKLRTTTRYLGAVREDLLPLPLLTDSAEEYITGGTDIYKQSSFLKRLKTGVGSGQSDSLLHWIYLVEDILGTPGKVTCQQVEATAHIGQDQYILGLKVLRVPKEDWDKRVTSWRHSHQRKSGRETHPFAWVSVQQRLQEREHCASTPSQWAQGVVPFES